MYDNFDIYVSGQLIDGADLAQVRRALCRMNGINEAKAVKLLSGVPVKVKSNVDVETASKYRATFRKIGILIDVRPSDSAAGRSHPPASEPKTEIHRAAEPTVKLGSAEADLAPSAAGISVEEEAEPELLPANTGTLADYSVRPPAQPLPDISSLSIDASGADLDDSPKPPPTAIDTSHLSAEPARLGSLEDCVVEKPVRPIPDISHLRLLD